MTVGREKKRKKKRFVNLCLLPTSISLNERTNEREKDINGVSMNDAQLVRAHS